MTRALDPGQLQPGRLVYVAVLVYAHQQRTVTGPRFETGFVPGTVETIAGDRVVLRELVTGQLRVLAPSTPLEGDPHDR